MFDLTDGRLLMDAAFSALLIFEVLDGVRNVSVLSFHAGGFEGLIQKAPGRADEGTTLQVFLIAGLLADKGERSADRTFAKDGLVATVNHRFGRGDHPVQLGQASGFMSLLFQLNETFLHLRPVR